MPPVQPGTAEAAGRVEALLHQAALNRTPVPRTPPLPTSASPASPPAVETAQGPPAAAPPAENPSAGPRPLIAADRGGAHAAEAGSSRTALQPVRSRSGPDKPGASIALTTGSVKAAPNVQPASAAAPGSAAALEPLVARLAQLRAGQSATVSLDAEKLGTVLVRFVRRHGRWQVHLVTERGDAAALLARDLHRLEASLDRSLEGARVEVHVDGQSGGEPQPENEAAGGQTPQQRSAMPSPAPVAAGSSASPAPAMHSSAGRLDVLT